MTEDPTMRILATLMRDGYVRREDASELLEESIQSSVRSRLDQVGLELVLSVHSDAWGVVIRPDLVRQTGTEWIVNDRGLRRNTIALIVILWKDLILPRRLITNENAVPHGQVTLDRQAIINADDLPITSLEKLFSDYGKRFGRKSILSGLLTYLRRVHVVDYETQGAIRPGPLLDILLPGPQMKHYVEQEIANLLAKEDFGPN